MPGGAEFMRRVRDVLGDTRSLSQAELERRRARVEEMVYEEIHRGNIPDFMRPQNFTTIRLERTIGGRRIVAEIGVCPDYLAIGSNDDFVLMPVNPLTAQRIADRIGYALPTQMLVDIIDDEARRTGGMLPFHAAPEIAGNVTNPRTGKPVIAGDPGGPRWNNQEYGFYEGRWMLSAEFTEEQNRLNQQSLSRAGNPTYLRSGHKKDVIYDPLAFGKPCVVIYHRGIQGLSNIHEITYHDYSHGIRFIDGNVQLTITERNGTIRREVRSVASILNDPDLFRLLSPTRIDVSRMYRAEEQARPAERRPQPVR